ncbi:unnamed protein product, partial [Adineta steineri]
PVNTNSSRRLITLSLQHQQQHIQSRRINRSTTLGASSISDQQNHGSPRHASRSAPCIRKWDVSSQKLENL